jgi:DNA-binding IclR family transcriptional regulator
VSVPVGTRRAMEMTASGFSMLISMNATDLESVVADILRRNSLFTVAQILQHKAEFNSTGYLKYDSRLIEGVVDLSIPLVSNRGQLLGALTVPYANNATCESSVEEVGKMLIEIHEYVSQRLVRI